MPTKRKYSCPLTSLINAAELLAKSLSDSAYQSAMSARLGSEFITAFSVKIAALTSGASALSSKTGHLSRLTAQQEEDFQEMVHLAQNARRSARLAFAGQDTVLSAEFQVGEAESHAQAAVIARTRLTHAAAVKYATELQSKGWIPADTLALGAAISKVEEIAFEQEHANGDRLGLTNEKIIAANALYADCLTIQNAARLQYPGGTNAAGHAKNVTERAHFLLDSFPPRERSKAETRNSNPAAANPATAN